MNKKLSHIDQKGNAKMVDLSGKPASDRLAIAEAVITMQAETLAAIKANKLKKGDALAVAKIAAIMAAKQTAQLIPLCHPIKLEHIEISFAFGKNQISITARARAFANTGVEMEALLAVAVAALTLYDMAKALDRTMVIEHIRLLKKSGGTSGDIKIK